jgi:hypothetical protein
MRWAAHARARSEMFRPMRLGVDELAKALAADDANEAIDEANDTGLTECPRCGFTGPVEAVRRHRKRAGHDEAAPDEDADVEAGFVAKAARPEQRFTFSPLYLPNTLDAHGEFATADDLQEAAWDYFRKGDRKLRKQHGSQVIGEVVEMTSWPFAHEAELTSANGTVRKQKFPAGTVYCGVVWTPEAWTDVKAGKLTGYSMGGSTVRTRGVPLP